MKDVTNRGTALNKHCWAVEQLEEMEMCYMGLSKEEADRENH